MKKFSVTDLAHTIKADSKPKGHYASFFTGVSIDSRTTQPQNCFFAVKGENFDGHDYVAEALDKGAACAVVENSKAEKFAGMPVLKVADPVKALGNLAREYRRRINFKVVAITGSVGKTMTRQITYHVLSKHHKAKQSPKNYNNYIGLPITLLSAEPDDQIIITELGSNHPGEIAYLTDIAMPDIALVTNVYPAHLEGFGDLQTVIEEKLSISKGLKSDGAFIINADFDCLVDRAVAEGMAFSTFGKTDSADIQAKNISMDGTSSSFIIEDKRVFLPLPGLGNVENAIAAWAICKQFGVNIDNFAQAAGEVQPAPMRAEPLKIGTLTVINDCYNANPASMRNALDILTQLGSQKKRTVFICGDMAELGQQTQALHTKLGADIAQSKVQLLLTAGKYAGLIADAARQNAEYNLQTKTFKDTISVCNNLAKFIKNNDIILVKGSRTAKLELVVEKLKELFA